MSSGMVRIEHHTSHSTQNSLWHLLCWSLWQIRCPIPSYLTSSNTVSGRVVDGLPRFRFSLTWRYDTTTWRRNSFWSMALRPCSSSCKIHALTAAMSSDLINSAQYIPSLASNLNSILADIPVVQVHTSHVRVVVCDNTRLVHINSTVVFPAPPFARHHRLNCVKICRHCYNTIVMPTHHQNVVSLITAMIKASSFSFGHCTNRNQSAVSSPILCRVVSVVHVARIHILTDELASCNW